MTRTPFFLQNELNVSIFQHQDLLGHLPKNVVSSRGDRTVGSLGNNAGPDLVSVVGRDDLLHGSRHKDVAVFVEQIVLVARVGLGSGEADDGAVGQLILLELFGVDAVLAADGAVPLENADALGSSSGQVAAGVEADITEALDDEGLATPSGGVLDHGHVVGLVDKVVQTMENSASGSRCSSVNATLERSGSFQSSLKQ